MAIRFEVNNCTLRLFSSRGEAESFSESIVRSEGGWGRPVHYECGWLVSWKDEVLYDSAGRVPDDIAAVILKGAK